LTTECLRRLSSHSPVHCTTPWNSDLGLVIGSASDDGLADMLANPRGSKVLFINMGRRLPDNPEATQHRFDALSLLMRGLALLGVPAFAAGDHEKLSGSDGVSLEVVRLDGDPLTVWRHEDFNAHLVDPAVGIVYIAGAWLEEDLLLAAIEGVELGYDVRLLADISIARSAVERDIALRRLEQHGVIMTSGRQTLLEWALAADDESLRAEIRSLL
jgi:hypothetical protein